MDYSGIFAVLNSNIAELGSRMSEQLLEMQHLTINSANDAIRRSLIEHSSQISAIMSNFAASNTAYLNQAMSQMSKSVAETAKSITDLNLSTYKLFLQSIDVDRLIDDLEENIEWETELTDEDKEFIKDSTLELAKDPRNANEKFYDFSKDEKLKRKYYIPYIILRILLSIFIVGNLQEWGAGVTKSVLNKLKSEPTSNSEVIGALKKNENVFVIGSVPNYYYVMVESEESGGIIPRLGYITKRSIKLNEQEEEE